MHRIEIDAGGRGNAGFLQHAGGEGVTVIGEARNVGVKIKRAVDRQKRAQSRARQPLDQKAAIVLVAMLDRFELIAAVEGGFGRDLRQSRHRNRKVLLQAFDRAHQARRHHHPADAPAGHAEIFGKRIDDDRVRRKARRALRREGIIEAVIDFIGDDGNAGVFGAADQFGERLAGHHRSGRIGRRRDDQPLERRLAMGREKALAGERPACLHRRFDADRLAAERRENMPVRRIAGQRHRDPIAGVEGREKGEHEARGGARRDDDAFGSDVEAVPLGISARDPPPQ